MRRFSRALGNFLVIAGVATVAWAFTVWAWQEVLALQACHPRFFATHRYIAYARLVSVRMRGSSTGISATALAAAASS